MTRLLPVAAVVVLSIGAGAWQPATQPAGAIAGTLTSADLGRPVRRAAVKLVSAQPGTTKTTTTDADGRFVFANLPPGDYTLSASKAGFQRSSAPRPRCAAAGSFDPPYLERRI